MNDQTRNAIDEIIARVLKDARLKDPPFDIKTILEFLEIHRSFYDLDDPSLIQRCWHRIQIGKYGLKDLLGKIKLAAVWLPDQDQILVDKSLPSPKKEWASFHDTIHTLLPWHKQFFLGDTAQTLDPDFQEMLESEANYGASALMFGGEAFTKDALDTLPSWSSIEVLKRRYKKSLVTTQRRYVEHGHDIPMVMVVSTPIWLEKPPEQSNRCRHFVTSRNFMKRFGEVNSDIFLRLIDLHSAQRRGGIVAEFDFRLTDNHGNYCVFHAETFFNSYYLLTFCVHIPISRG